MCFSKKIRGFLSIYMFYLKMKVGVKYIIKKLSFEHAIILRLSMILRRKKSKNVFLKNIFTNLNKLRQNIQNKTDIINLKNLECFEILSTNL